jgi:hydrogenase nickel incorporation protein HypA/HybF
VHEYSIALEVWGSVAAAAREHGRGRVRSIRLEVGVLNLIEDEQLSFWVAALAERDGSPGVELEIVQVPGRVKCRGCGAEGELRVPQGTLPYFAMGAVRCAECGSGEVEVVGGRDLKVVTAEIETEGRNGRGE